MASARVIPAIRDIGRTRVSRWLAFAALMAAAGVLHRHGLAPLTGWVARPFGEARVPLLLGLLVAGHGALLLAPRRARSPVLLAVSLACGAVACWQLVVGGVLWCLALRRVLWSGARPALTILFPIATVIAVIALADASRAPAWVAAHPWLWTVSVLFATSWFLRALVVWHEVRTGAPRPRAVELLTYFLFAPFALAPPYMLALPRLALVSDGVAALDPAVQRSGLRWLAYGLALQVALALALRGGVDVDGRLEAALRAGDWWLAAPLLLLRYPGYVVVAGVAGGALLVGLTRSFGVAMGPAFRAPLLADSVADWWRRYNTHFRDLLVDLFWYPIALRYRRRPVLAGFLGCAAVFLLGNVPLHWPRQAALDGWPWAFPWGVLAECLVMVALVGTSLVLERRRRPVAPWWTRWRRRATTWVAVCFAAVVVGYHLDYRQRAAPWEEVLARVDEARTADEAAALVPALEEQVGRQPLAVARRAVLARTLALAGRTDEADRELALARALPGLRRLADTWELVRAEADLALRCRSDR